MDAEKLNQALYDKMAAEQERFKPSIKAQLAAKPIPGDQPITKPKEREVR